MNGIGRQCLVLVIGALLGVASGHGFQDQDAAKKKTRDSTKERQRFYVKYPEDNYRKIRVSGDDPANAVIIDGILAFITQDHDRVVLTNQFVLDFEFSGKKDATKAFFTEVIEGSVSSVRRIKTRDLLDELIEEAAVESDNAEDSLEGRDK